MGLRSALVDRAYIQRRRPDAVKVNGRTVHSLAETAAIRCRLTINDSAERLDEGRKVSDSRPSLTLYRRDGDGLEVVPAKTDRVRVVSRELGEGVYEIDGKPQPIRKKRRLLGWLVNVVRLEED